MACNLTNYVGFSLQTHCPRASKALLVIKDFLLFFAVRQIKPVRFIAKAAPSTIKPTHGCPNSCSMIQLQRNDE